MTEKKKEESFLDKVKSVFSSAKLGQKLINSGKKVTKKGEEEAKKKIREGNNPGKN